MSRNLPGAVGSNLNAGNTAAVNISGTEASWAGWINPAAVTGTQSLMGKVASLAASGYQYNPYMSAANLGLIVGDGTGIDSIASSVDTAFVANAWQMWGIRKGGGIARFFRNGLKVGGDVATTRSIAAQVSNLRLGGRDPADIFFNGLMAEFALWNVALTDEEFLSLGRGVCPLFIRPASLRGYWPLFGLAYPEADLSGGGSNITQTGAVPAGLTHAPVGRMAA